MKRFTITGKVWRWQSPNGPQEGGWYFVYVNEKISRQIKDYARNEKKAGFQFVRVKATLGKTSWTTSLFPTSAKGGSASGGKASGPYLLAIKADIRKKEGIDEGDAVKITCALL
ncbi:MAG: DUF1905 domain-containing protein [Minisyncoccia bacterium]